MTPEQKNAVNWNGDKLEEGYAVYDIIRNLELSIEHRNTFI